MRILDKPYIVIPTVLILLGTASGTAAWFQHHTAPPVAAEVAAPSLPPVTRQDPQVLAVMDSLQLDSSHLNLIYGPDPKSTAIASFSGPNTLYVTPGTYDNLNTIVSHEYIHYVQDTLNPSQARYFYPFMTQLLANNPDTSDRMQPYRDQGCTDTCLQMETEAVACTEVPDDKLATTFVAFCNQYLPRRSVLVR